MLFLAPAGPFVLGNLGKPKFEMNSIHLWGFRGLGGPSAVYWTVDAVRGGEVVDYLRWVLGAAAKNAALSPEPIAKKGPEIHGPPGAAAI